jgi:hypothetical protein
MQEIILNCTILEDLSVDNHGNDGSFLLPVAALEELTPTIDLPYPERSLLIFTSKNAVDIWKKSMFERHWKPDKKMQKGLQWACVGLETLKRLQSALSELQINSPRIRVPPEKMGLKATLEELLVSQDKKDFLNTFIFTAQGGKTNSTLKLLPPELSMVFSNAVVIELYKLIDISHHIKERLQTLFANTIPEILVFRCRSGLTLKFTVLQLVSLHQCSTPFNLPSRIKFELWGESAHEAAKFMGLTESQIRTLHAGICEHS